MGRVTTERTALSKLPLANLGTVTLCSLLQMVLQFLLVVWLARRFGTSPEMDAFNSAFAIPLAITGVLVSPLPLVLVPELVRLRREENESGCWSLASRVLVLGIGSGVLLAFAATLLAEPICSVLFAGFGTARLEAAAGCLRWLAWLVPLNAAVALLQAAHHARQRYLLAALSNVAGVALSLGWIVAVPRLDLTTLCAALLAGSLLATLVLAVPLARLLALPWRGSWRGIGLRRFSLLAAPLLFSAAYARLDPLVDRSIASFLDPGSISELGYAQRIVTALATLTASGLSVVIFPQLASFSADPRDPRLSELLATAWRFLAVLLIPCVAAVVFYGESIVADLFERQAFDASATEAVARLLTILLGVVVAGSVGEIAGKALYAMSETRLPALIAVVGFTIGVALKIALSRRFGVEGVALGTTLYFVICLAALLAALYQRIGGAMFGGLGGAVVQGTIGSVAAAAVGAIPLWLLDEGGALLGGLLGLIAYAAVLRMLGNEFLVRSATESSPGDDIVR